MNPDPSPPQTLNTLLTALAAQRGGSNALIAGDKMISFTELAHRANRLAAGLAERGVGCGDRVAIWLANVPAWVELTFALAQLGAVAVAINTQYRQHEVEDLVERSGARLLVLQPRQGKTDYLGIVAQFDDRRIAGLEAFVLVGEDAAINRLKGRPAVPYSGLLSDSLHEADHGAPDLPCNVFTSSGTTSSPKLVQHRQRAVVRHALAVAESFGFRNPDAVILGMLPFGGVFGFSAIMAAIAAGRPTVLQPVYDAGEAVALIERHQVTHSAGADEMFRRILEVAEPAARIASLKEGAFANFGTDAAALVEQGAARGIKLFQTYGSSEVLALMTYPASASGPERWKLGGGEPCSPEIQVRACQPESGEELPEGQSGELQIHGPNVMAGYMNNPEANREVFTTDGYVCTGDLGYMEGAESFVYLARMGDALRLGGYLVNPREIETYLESHAAIGLAQVVAVDTDRGQRPVAFVTLEPGAVLDESAVIQDCRATMAKYKAPIRIVTLEAFPTTPSANGEKIQKTKLRDMGQALIAEESGA